MRERTGVPPGGDIIGHIESYEPSKRDAAFKVVRGGATKFRTAPTTHPLPAQVHEMEVAGVEATRVQDGFVEVVQWLVDQGIPCALLTRNSATCVEIVLSKLPQATAAALKPALGREFTPPKPAPDALLHIASSLGVPSSGLIMVGDGVDDVVAAAAAGAVSVYLTNDEPLPPQWEGPAPLGSAPGCAPGLGSDCHVAAATANRIKALHHSTYVIHSIRQVQEAVQHAMTHVMGAWHPSAYSHASSALLDKPSSADSHHGVHLPLVHPFPDLPPHSPRQTQACEADQRTAAVREAGEGGGVSPPPA